MIGVNYKYLLVSLFFLTFSACGLAQAEAEKVGGAKDTTLVNILLEKSKGYFADSTEKAVALAMQARHIADSIQFPRGQAYASKNIGIANYYLGKYMESLEYYRQSLGFFKTLKDNVGVANIYNNIGAVYYAQGDDVKALENYLQSLKYAELSGDKLRVLTTLNNVGTVYNNKEATHNKALQYYLQAYPIAEQLGKKDELGAISVNIGSIYADNKDHTKAMFYFDKALKVYGNSEGSQHAYNAIGGMYNKEKNFDEALRNHSKGLAISKKLNDKLSIVNSIIGIGKVYVAKGDYLNAVENLREAEAPAVELGANTQLKDIYEQLAQAYAKRDDYKNAFRYQSLFANFKDTIYNLANDKKLGSLQFDFDLQKKQGEINLLTKVKALNELQIERQKLAKNAFAGGMILVFFIALLIFRSYRVKVKTNKKLDQQKMQIENLLLNILPAEVAKELQLNGYATPRNFEMVSVMFTDFKSFTLHADKLSPQELVQELNTCFIAFDNIIGKYGLEKIKTIGDSYMCAGGLPTPDKSHVLNMVKASLEIQEYIVNNNRRKVSEGQEPWDLRIGVHLGPVVAGVVGKKKYAYDIWGSTVNIASRLESNGEPEQVNISSTVYEWVKDDFSCSYRGKIYAKNVGEVDMYFVGPPGTVFDEESSPTNTFSI